MLTTPSRDCSVIKIIRPFHTPNTGKLLLPKRTQGLLEPTAASLTDDLDHVNDNTFTTQKWVNLYDIMLDPFEGEGRFVTMDLKAQIGHHEWGMNMVRTSNDNRTGADTKEKKKGMKKCTYKSIMFQHNTEPLCYAMWANNNIVRILSNCHPPEIIIDSLMRKKKTDGVRDRQQSAVPCPQQNQYYSQSFHLIIVQGQVRHWNGIT